MNARLFACCLLNLMLPMSLAAQTCEGLPATLTGTAGNDNLLGTAGADVIVALGGNDLVDGASGSDIVCGGDGDDILIGGTGSDRLFGESGDDDLRGSEGDDAISGGSGHDSLRGDAGNDQLTGDADDDVMVGAGGGDQCDGVSGVDSADSACETRMNLDADVLFLTLYAPDGTPLDGELYVPTNDAAANGTREVAWVFRHGAQGSYAGGVAQSAGLWGVAQGFTVLSLNGRDWGVAAGGGNTLFEDTTLDMAVGIDFLQRIGFNTVFVAGHSGGTQAAGVYPALSDNDPRVAAIGLFGVVRDGREAATDILFLPESLYDSHIALSNELVADGRGEQIRDYLTTFGIDLQRSARTFLSYWGPDSRSVVVREITAARVPVFLLRANGDGFTPDSYSVDVRNAALNAGVDAAYVELPYPAPPGPTGVNAHSLLGVERAFLAETTAWLLAKVPAATNFLTSRPGRIGGNYLPVPDAGPDTRLVTSGGESVTLNGRNSVDLDGTLVSYAWTQTDGRTVTLRSADSSQASFAVPRTTSRLEFELAVTDNGGATAIDTVTVDLVGLQPGGGSGSPDLLVLGALALGALHRRRTA